MFISSFLIVFLWFKDGNMLAAAESGMPFYDLHRTLGQVSHAWSSLGLGNYTGGLVATIPTFWFLDKLTGLGLTNVAIEAILFWFLFFTSGTGIYLLIKEYFPKVKTRFLVIGVYFYWFNPLSLINVWHRFLFNYMFLFALLPITIYLFTRGVREKKLMYAIYIAYVTIIFSFTFSSITFLLLFLGTILVFALMFIFFGRYSRFFILKFLILFGFGFLFLNFWWISQTVHASLNSNLTVSVKQFYSTSGNLNNLTILSRSLGGIADILRLLHISSYQGGQLWQGIFLSSPMVVVEFLFTGLIIWVILNRRKEMNIIIWAIVLVLAIFLMKGNNPPFGEVFQFLFISFFPLQFFRNPFEKFSFLLMISSTILLVLGLNDFERKIKNHAVSSLAFAVILGIFGFPYWSESLFRNRSSQDIPQISNYEVVVPSFYKQMDEFLKSKVDTHRFVSLPLGPEGLIYAWEGPYRGVDPYYELFSTPNISNNTVIPFYYDFVSEIVKHQLQMQMLSFLKYMSANFLVLRKDVNYQASKVANPTDTELRLNSWEKNGDVTKTAQFGSLVAYEANGKYVWPKIFVTRQRLYTNTYDASLLDKYATGRFAVFGTEGSSVESTNTVLVPNAAFLFDKRWDQSHLSDEEIVNKLFYVNHLPNSFVYPLIRFKEKLDTPPTTDPEGRLIFKVGILGKRASEIYKLQKTKEDVLKKASENDYAMSFEDLKFELGNYIGSIELGSFLKDALIYQAELLKRAKADHAYGKVKDFLVEKEVWPRNDLTSAGFMVYRFDVKTQGQYVITLDKSPLSASWYINGKEVGFDLNNFPNFQVNLSSGVNEISIPFEVKNLRESILYLGHLEPSSSVLPIYKIEIPNTPTTYNVTFDYNFEVGEEFLMKFIQNIDQEINPNYTALVKRDKTAGWRHFSQEFTTNEGATDGFFEFLQNYSKFCNYILGIEINCEYPKKDFKVNITNFKIEKVVLPQATLSSMNWLFNSTTTTADSRSTNNTFYEINIDKQSEEAETLVFSEMYNPDWNLFYEDGTALENGKHTLVNFFANSWLINKKGKYKLYLVFSQENSLNKAKMISKVSITFFVGFTLMYFVKKKWQRE